MSVVAEPQPSARIDRVELLGGFHARRDAAPHGERGDLSPLARSRRHSSLVKAPGRLAGSNVTVICGFLAGTDRTLGEIGDRAAAGGHHVEDHQRACRRGSRP